MNKEYRANSELIKYVKKMMTYCKVQPEYGPMLEDILLRRAYEFGLSKDQIEQDCLSMIYNLERIEIADMPDGYERAAGIYTADKKTITLDREYIQSCIKSGEFDMIYQTLTHEVYHALCRDEAGNDRLVSWNNTTKEWNTSLREAIVEKAADRCVYSRKGEANAYFHQNRQGYTEITFVTDLIEAAYGVTEKSFLGSAISGRERMIASLSGTSGEDIGVTNLFLDGIEANYMAMHKAQYRWGDESEMSTGDRRRTVVDSLGAMYRLSEWKLQSRIANADFSTIENARRYAEYFKYSSNKLHVVMRQACCKFNGLFPNDTEFEPEVFKDSEIFREDTLTRLGTISQVLGNLDKMPSEEEALRVINLAKEGDLSEEEITKLESYGIKLERPEFFKISPEFMRIRNNIDFSENTWDNTRPRVMSALVFGGKTLTLSLQNGVKKVRRTNNLIIYV